jgi:hypothetical protein
MTDITIPKSHQRSKLTREWYLEGHKDGRLGRPLRGELIDVLKERYGVGVSRAYKAGYGAGKQEYERGQEQ